MKFAGPNLAERSDNRMALRDRVAMLAVYATLQLAGAEGRKRLRHEFVRSCATWADELRTRGRTTPVVRRQLDEQTPALLAAAHAGHLMQFAGCPLCEARRDTAKRADIEPDGPLAAALARHPAGRARAFGVELVELRPAVELVSAFSTVKVAPVMALECQWCGALLQVGSAFAVGHVQAHRREARAATTR